MKTLKHTSSSGMPLLRVALIVMAMAMASSPLATAEGHDDAPPANQNIMIALLLDTSNSMDGLIDQAKSQLWKIVNELAGAKCDDSSRPSIKIALYEYGNDGLSERTGYIRLVSPLTNDLDLISEKLFALKTNGGNEFCGHVIKTSLTDLVWSTSRSDLKMIFIAGNEPFTQGEVPFRMACSLAKEKDVVVNTIFCGPYNEGINTSWKDGADLTGGTYMSIEQDRKTVYVPTPYDDKITALNEKLNDTYVYYGASGHAKKEMQATQDRNAKSYGTANEAERAISKSSHAYENTVWDLVDANKSDDKVIEKAKDSELPKEMKGMNLERRKAYVAAKSNERKKIQQDIQDLAGKRDAYIKAHTTKEQEESMLDGAMIKAIKDQARSKNLNWK